VHGGCGERVGSPDVPIVGAMRFPAGAVTDNESGKASRRGVSITPTRASSSPSSQILGGSARVLGGVGAVAMRRIELTPRWDRQLLDEYEAVLLAHDRDLRLLHNHSFPARLRVRPLESSAGRAQAFELWLTKRVPPGLAVMLLIISLGAIGLIFGLLR
jgi:hypothetical protein